MPSSRSSSCFERFFGVGVGVGAGSSAATVTVALASPPAFSSSFTSIVVESGTGSADDILGDFCRFASTVEGGCGCGRFGAQRGCRDM